MNNENRESIRIKDDWIRIPEIKRMLGGFFTCQRLGNMARFQNAPFYMRKIGGRYYARREDVEQYIKEINNATRSMHEQKKSNIKPVSILESFRKDCKTESIHSIVTFGYGDLCYRDWGSVGVKVPEINAKRKIFDACIANSDTFRDITKCKRRANKFRVHFCIHISELMNENGEIPSLYTAKNENGYVIFAFVFVGFELDINCRLRAIYMFVQNGIYGTEREIIKWCNTTNEIETTNN